MTDDLPRQGIRWTSEEESYLRWAYSQGLPLEWAAKHLGRTVPATKQKAHRMGLKPPRPKDAPKHDIATRLRILLGEEVRPPTGRRLGRRQEISMRPRSRLLREFKASGEFLKVALQWQLDGGAR